MFHTGHFLFRDIVGFEVTTGSQGKNLLMKKKQKNTVRLPYNKKKDLEGSIEM